MLYQKIVSLACLPPSFESNTLKQASQADRKRCSELWDTAWETTCWAMGKSLWSCCSPTLQKLQRLSKTERNCGQKYLPFL